MCVIACVESVRPSEKMIEDMFSHNRDGGGIAYREGEGDDREVVWHKGLNLTDIKDYCFAAPLPYIAHFRVASSGGVCDELTHPFPIQRDTTLETNGRTRGDVLFHNGDWKSWRAYVLEAARVQGIPLPLGRKWSDSRAMAFLCSIYGIGFMDFIEMKGIAFGPHRLEIFNGEHGGWVELDQHGVKIPQASEEAGIWCSNDFFVSRPRKNGNTTAARGPGAGTFGHVCRFNMCNNVNIDDQGWCPKHRDGTLQPIMTSRKCGKMDCEKYSIVGRFFCGEHALPNDLAACRQHGCQQVALKDKDYCAIHFLNNTNPEVLAEAGGPQPHVVPFRQSQELIPSLEVAEQMFLEGKISRSFLKKLRKTFEKVSRKREANLEKIDRIKAILQSGGHTVQPI